MGLDTSIHKYKIKSEKEQLYDKLIGASRESEEVFYWRKHHHLIDWFGRELGQLIENCEDYEVTKENFINFLHDLENEVIDTDTKDEDIEKLNKLLKETDFETTKFYFYNWW